jgi:hypothetical protein
VTKLDYSCAITVKEELRFTYKSITEMLQNILAIVLLFLAIEVSSAQTVGIPNYAMKSHETLEISKIDAGSDKTIVYLNIENRIDGGNFCADRNIYITDPTGAKLRLTKAVGIPVCPDSYKFKKTGEKLHFSLEFPPLKPGCNWIDITEECSNNCFSFYGVVLNSEINRKIDDAISLAENNEPSKALSALINIADDAERRGEEMGGVLYIYIIKLARETGSTVKAAEWYRRLESSALSGLPLYLKHLNSSSR